MDIPSSLGMKILHFVQDDMERIQDDVEVVFGWLMVTFSVVLNGVKHLYVCSSTLQLSILQG